MPIEALAAARLVADTRARIRKATAANVRAACAGTTIIDVREPCGFDAGHLPGAVNIPRGVLESGIEAHAAMACATHPALAGRDRPLLVHYRSGGRSAPAAEVLGRMGFADVASMAGGIVAWRETGLPVTMSA